MRTEDGLFISPKFQKIDYITLGLTPISKAESWEKAIAIFDDRIRGRHINQIDMLMDNIADNGFSIMALDCLLIEALYQFRCGLKETRRRQSTQYGKFMSDYLNVSLDEGEAFYQNIRCGILHSAQTKGNSELTDKNDYILTLEEGRLCVSVCRLTQEIISYLSRYENELRNPQNVELRQKFIKKMNML